MHARHERVDLLRGALVIDGERHEEASGGSLEHINPATSRAQRRFPLAGTKEVDVAVAAARSALSGWREWTPVARRDLILRIAASTLEHADELATILTLETGAPLIVTRNSAAGLAAWFQYYAGWIDKVVGETVSHSATGVDFTLLEPFGVVAKILTWNAPLGGVGMGVSPALAAGCTVVVKPPELAPFSSVRFAEICELAGLPPGVLNVIPGGPEGGQALVSHPGVDKISFTGGPATAARIQAASSDALTPLVLELGGKSANLVFADANLEVAVGQAASITLLTGQVCTAPSRLLVDERVYDEVVDQVVARVSSVRMGDPFEDGVTVGPVISSAARDRIVGLVERAVAGGARIVCGGGRPGGELADGFFVEPTVLVDVDNKSEIGQTEVFGPVLCVMRFRDEDEAVDIANDSPFGLAAYVHTADLNRALRLAQRLDAGTIGINGGTAPAGNRAPYGGFKDSGYGKEGGREGILEFLRVKNVNIALR
jgi:acyl-CoA reductase-like NAD-dependent aldehyde dehydrogenase